MKESAQKPAGSDKATRALALLVTCVAIGGALLLSQRNPAGSQGAGAAPPATSRQERSSTAPPPSPVSGAPAAADEADAPEAVVWAMTDAWRAGDARKYLDCFADPIRAKLQRTADDMGETKFSEFLRATNREVVGLAISGVNRHSAETAEVPLEYVYRGKNESQPHVVQKISGAWKIADIKGAARIPTLVPYGARVFTPQR